MGLSGKLNKLLVYMSTLLVLVINRVKKGIFSHSFMKHYLLIKKKKKTTRAANQNVKQKQPKVIYHAYILQKPQLFLSLI